jgi:hypothetical protein
MCGDKYASPLKNKNHVKSKEISNFVATTHDAIEGVATKLLTFIVK